MTEIKEIRCAIGLDLGTTHVKACMVREDGEVLAVSETDNEKRSIEEFGECFLPEELFEKSVACIRAVVAKSGCIPMAIGITSMAESGVFLDELGEPLLPVIPWSSENGECLLPEYLSGETLYRRTGLLWHPKYTVNQVLRLRKEYPEIGEKIRGFLSVADYILYRLSGRRCTDASLACRTGMYDIVNSCWWEEMIEFAGLEGCMPEVLETGDMNSAEEAEKCVWPTLNFAGAKILGLSTNVTVRVCGHDHLCAACGEGLRMGEILNSMGTSEVYIGWLSELNLSHELYKHGIQQGRFQDRYYWMSNLPSSGASVEWLRSVLSHGKKISYQELMEGQSVIPSPVVYLPFVNGCGTHRSGQEITGGGFLGIRANVGRSELLQGIYDGVAMESRVILDGVRENGIDTKQILTVGGGTMNRAFVQTKADVTGRTFCCSRNTQAVAVGAAMIAGEFPDGERKIAYETGERREYRAAYQKKYLIYQKLTGIDGKQE